MFGTLIYKTPTINNIKRNVEFLKRIMNICCIEEDNRTNRDIEVPEEDSE